MSSFIGHQSSKLKKKHFKPKHQKAKVFRANEPLLSVFMWGINHTIHELTHVNIPVMLMPEDFKAYSKVKIENYNYNEESMPKKFMFKEYAPLVFRNLRERFGIEDIDYLASLTKSQPISLDESSGRSHSNSFYKSYNNKLILKKLDGEEIEQLLTFLKHYHPYVVERNSKTLLPQYLGLYRITFENTEYYYVVMRNILSCPPTLPIHRKYDLKGSTVDREASEKERSKPNPTYKDNDFVKDNIKLYIKPEDKQRIMETLEADCAFLSKENLMDYSLCLGIHDCDRYEEDAKKVLGTALSVNTGSEEDEEFASIPHSSYSPVRKVSGNSFNNGSLNNSDNNLSQKEDSNTSDQDLILESGIRTIDLNRDIYAVESRADAPQRLIYFLGLVDVLTQYGIRKRTAQTVKTVKHGSQADMISTVHPDQYAKRFCDFISKAFS